MALSAKIKDFEFGVGDKVRLHQRIKDGDKSRESIFEGIILKIKGRGLGATLTMRRVGEAGIGIEKIFPLALPNIEKVIVVKKGLEGVRRSKLYYIRTKSPSEIDMIFKKAAVRRAPKVQKAKKTTKKLKRSAKIKK